MSEAPATAATLGGPAGGATGGRAVPTPLLALVSLFSPLVRYPTVALCLLAGSALLADLHRTLDPLALVAVLLALGTGATWYLSRGDRWVVRGFALTYAVCVLMAGLCQAYSQWAFGTPLSTSDADAFYHAILRQPPYYRLGERFPVNAPYAVLVWQSFYRICLACGLNFGPWIGVLLNAFTVGCVGALTVRMARELVEHGIAPNPPDGHSGRAQAASIDARLRRAGTLCAACGMFWLFGALFLRDAFTLLVNTVVLWTLVRAVQKMSAIRLLVALVTVAVGAWVVLGLRPASAPLFALFALLALVTWFWYCRPGLGRLLAVGILAVGLVLLYAHLLAGVQSVTGTVAAVAETYERVGTGATTEGSLGMALIVQQPLPVRLLLGSFSLIVNPIPLWAGLRPGMVDYIYLKAWHGIYLVAIVPLAITGIREVLRAARRHEPHAAAPLFLTLYALGALGAVAATSLETRHLGQFLPAMILLAVLPDLEDPARRGELRLTGGVWFGLVAVAHVGWAVLKFMW